MALPYWAAFYIWVFSDLYLTWPSLGLVVKLLVPLVGIAHLVGVGLGMASWKTQRSLALWAVGLNGLPLVGGLVFLWWLFFGVKI